MKDYYKDELLNIVDPWPVERLDNYIVELEERIRYTREQITMLKAIRKRKLRNVNLKENGPRG